MKAGVDHVESVSRLDTSSLRAVSLTTQAYDRLRRGITEGALAENSALVIAQMVRDFGISHTPIREALARLHSEGLVSFLDNVGYRVARHPSEGDLRYWMEARIAHEPACARLAAMRIDAGELQILREVNERIRKETLNSDFDGVRLFADLNATFHRTIVAATRNPYLERAHERIWLGANFSRVRFRQPVDQQYILAEHDDLVSALANRDGSTAAALMERHIVGSLERDLSRVPAGRSFVAPTDPDGRRA